MITALAALALALPTGETGSYVPAAAMRAPFAQCPAPRPGAPSFAPQTISAFEAQWFSQQLAAAEEPVFRQPPGDGLRARYRFTIVPSFASTVTVRIDEHADGQFTLHAKRLSGLGGYDPGHVAGRASRRLTSEETGSLRALLAREDVRTLDNDPCSGVLGVDGDEWLFEALEPVGRQRFVRIWEPQGGAMKALGDVFRRLAGPEFVHPPPGARPSPRQSLAVPLPRP